MRVITPFFNVNYYLCSLLNTYLKFEPFSLLPKTSAFAIIIALPAVVSTYNLISVFSIGIE